MYNCLLIHAVIQPIDIFALISTFGIPRTTSTKKKKSVIMVIKINIALQQTKQIFCIKRI